MQLNKDSSLQGKTRGNDKRKPSNLLFEIELEEQGKLINLEVLRKERKLFDEYFGLIQSRLYEGSFQSEEYKKEDFFSKLEDETFAVQFLKLNRKNIEKKNLNEKNISSHLSAELIRYLIPKVKPVDIKMTKRKPL
ncbi:MAG TPA: hypothetical protein VMG13_26930 [Trebonia sp.]|nr:hypothetical protein [Trebonia sp.]